MVDTTLLASIAQQLMSGNTVDVNGKLVHVRRTSRQQLKTLAFTMDEREISVAGIALPFLVPPYFSTGNP